MIAGQELQNLILELSGRMTQIEQDHASRFSPPLAPAEITAVRFIVRNSPVQMSELARGVGLAQSSATNLADKLCRRALAQRQRPEANRRVVMLMATDKACALIAAVEEDQVALCDELVAGLAADEADLLRRFLGRLTDVQLN
ncbi:MAG: MarR family winged helix-turn-helix transcriptional regulator [Pseudomonadota bacterium]